MSSGIIDQAVFPPNPTWTLDQTPRLSTGGSASERQLFVPIGDRARIDSAACSSAWGFQFGFEVATDDSATAIDLFPWDDLEFERSPRSVLRGRLFDVVRDPGQRSSLTGRLFPHLLKGPPARRRLVHETLRWFAAPEDVLVNSLLLFFRYGDAEPLTVGAGLLLDLGAQSWPVLEAFARTRRPECAYFVTAIAVLRTVDVQKRLDLLRCLARSNDPELRWRILEALNEFSLDEATPVLEALAQDGGLDDAASSAAKEQLEPASES